MTTPNGSIPHDILAWRPVRALVGHAAFPLALQVVALGAVVVLGLNGLGLGTDLDPAELKLFRKTNLTTEVVWGLWWPTMIIAAVTLGRVWCTVCPMELVNRVGTTLARRLGLPQIRMGAWMRAGWATLLLYLTMQLLVAGVSIHRVPHYTAIMLALLFAAALVSGLVFREPRSFCSGLCPAAALLSVYGRFTPLQLSRRDRETCDRCETRDCVRGHDRHGLDRRSCPSLLRPHERRASDGCVLCMQCVKVCPHDNMGFGVVAPDAPVRAKVLLRPFEAAFVSIALGFVAHEVIGEIAWLDDLFHVPPDAVASLVPGLSFGWIEAAWFLLGFPALVWLAIAVVGRLLGHRSGAPALLLAAATGAAPVVALAHMAKAAAKLSSWGAFLPLALADPSGVTTFQQIRSGALDAPARLVGLSLVSWLTLLVGALVAWRAWRWIRQLPAPSVAAARAGMLTALLLFAAVFAVWAIPSP